ncbi:DUF883 family protein [Ramlibacter sp.]|uniref:DUF883 family protein n=1 Tax=Ramlibacter sp. TaxID=1917967 RepID=UPI003D0A4AA9
MNMNDIAPHLADDRERLARDLRAVVDDAEALLRHAAGDVGAGYGDARARLEKSLASAKAELVATQRAAFAKVEEAGRAADRAVREHPWQAIGIGAGIGLLVGLLVGRR